MPDNTTQAIAKLTASMETVVDSLAEVKSHAKEAATEVTNALADIKVMGNDLGHLKSQMDDIARLVRDGNGQPSLVQRLGTVETRQERCDEDRAVLRNEIIIVRDTVNKDIKELTAKLDSGNSARTLSRNQIIAAVLGMVITALMSLGSILAALIQR
jgi:DNA repair ATPase RecN